MTEWTCPRRCDITRQTKAERMIGLVIEEVEAVGTDLLLSDAVFLLVQAREKLADYVDGRPRA